MNILNPIFGFGGAHRAYWKAQRSAMREQRRLIRAQRHRSFFGRLIGLAWGLFWILFGLSLAFGGSEYRHDVFELVSNIGRWAADFFRSVIHGTSIQ